MSTIRAQASYLILVILVVCTLQEVKDLEEAVTSDKSSGRPIAKTMMVFMVRGIFTDIKFPYAQFPLSPGTGYDLFLLIWQAIDRLECNGIHVIGITADGASINRKLFRLHSPTEALVYKTTNVYTRREVFFFRSSTFAENHKKCFCQS